jgi:iron-sulfur cluster assembly protein/iron-sulfur cluster insertion protein
MSAVTPLTIRTKKQLTPPTLSPQAIEAVQHLLDQEDQKNLFLRLRVRPGGCAGFTYDLSFDNELAHDDNVSLFGKVKFVVDPESLALVSGATIEYSSSLQKSGFSVKNPNVSRSCGCGNSFS